MQDARVRFSFFKEENTARCEEGHRSDMPLTVNKASRYEFQRLVDQDDGKRDFQNRKPFFQ